MEKLMLNSVYCIISSLYGGYIIIYLIYWQNVIKQQKKKQETIIVNRTFKPGSLIFLYYYTIIHTHTVPISKYLFQVKIDCSDI